MKKNNYVQQLRADNPVFIVWKKIPLSMKLLFVFCFCFVGLLCANDSYAQRTMISVKAQNLTVKEVLSQIEAQSDFSFFYNDHHIDVDRRVSVVTEQSNIFTLLNEVFKNTNVKYAVRNKKIILSTQIVEAPAAKQTVQIKGKVTDMFGDPVIGATVMEDGTQNGTITDLDGNFILNTASANVTITVSYVGYMSQTVKAQSGKSLSVILKEDTKTLDEIVVVGFGTQKKVNLTGSVSTVNAEDLLSRPVSNVSQALQGLVPGMNFSYASDGNGGEIGADMKVNIRGAGTIGDGSNASPLILIDGMEGNMNMLNPNDIESISVLKDAAASSIYGSRAPFGVVLITTKKGKEGPTRIEASANFGVQQIAKRIEMMNSLEFLKINRLAYENADMEWPGEPEQGQILTNTDWQDEFFKLGTTQDYNLTLSGGNMNGNYLVSGNFFKQDGVVEGPWHKRYSLRVNTGYKKGIFTFGENMLVSRTETRPMTGTSFIDLLRMPPVIPVYDDTKAGGYGTGSTQYQTYGTNPIGQQETRDYRQTSNRIIGNVFAELEFFKCLKLKTNLGVEYHNWFDREKETYKQIRYLEVSNYDNQLLERKGDFTTIISENTLNPCCNFPILLIPSALASD